MITNENVNFLEHLVSIALMTTKKKKIQRDTLDGPEKIMNAFFLKLYLSNNKNQKYFFKKEFWGVKFHSSHYYNKAFIVYLLTIFSIHH